MEYEDKETMVLGILSELYNMQNLKDKRWEGAEDRHPEKTGCTEPHWMERIILVGGDSRDKDSTA